MKAVQYRSVGATPEVVTLPDPEPAPGEILVKVSAAGLCHSDIAVMDRSADQLSFPLPLTLGHEGAGVVAACGAGVTEISEGDAVAVYGPWGCGRCTECARGKENYCLRAAELKIFPPGLGAPGAVAEYLLVDDPRHLVPLDGLDPVKTAPLTDAGLTPYHAITRSLPKLTPGSAAVVIGAGGLGHMAIQMLRAMTSARVIALDVNEEKLDLARDVGAHETVLSDSAAAGKVRELTGGDGAAVIIDFVGADPTVATARDAVAVEGDVTVVGLGGGSLPVGYGTLPYEVSVASPYWGARAELIEVLDLARAGAIDVHVQTFGIDDAPHAYDLLRNGKIPGRAVIQPAR